jgi:hypothetical protein
VRDSRTFSSLHSSYHKLRFPEPPEMTNKRSRAQMGDLEGVHKSRQINLEGPQSNPHKRPRHTWSSDAKPNSVNPLKKKIRDVSRLLNRSESLPAGARMDNERALASYKLELADAMDEQRRQKMIKKYHMVRFFGEIFRPCGDI